MMRLFVMPGTAYSLGIGQGYTITRTCQALSILRPTFRSECAERSNEGRQGRQYRRRDTWRPSVLHQRTRGCAIVVPLAVAVKHLPFGAATKRATLDSAALGDQAKTCATLPAPPLRKSSRNSDTGSTPVISKWSRARVHAT
jgi:hypothetical protein